MTFRRFFRLECEEPEGKYGHRCPRILTVEADTLRSARNKARHQRWSYSDRRGDRCPYHRTRERVVDVG